MSSRRIACRGVQRPNRAGTLLIIALGIVGCGQNKFLCLDVPSVGIVVEARDAITGLNVTDSVRGVVEEGEYVDSLRPYSTSEGMVVKVGAAANRPGVYSIRIERPGYQLWIRSSVRVSATATCGVVAAEVVAMLVPN